MKQINANNFFLEGLTILFVGLKLTGVINWSWFWVLSPLIIQLVIAVILFLVFILLK